MAENIAVQKYTDDILLHSPSLNQIFQSVPYIMMIVDREGGVIKINHVVEKFTGKKETDVIGLLGGEVFSCVNSIDGKGCGQNPPCTICPIRSRVNRTFETGESIFGGEGELTVINNGAPLKLSLLISTAVVRFADTDCVLVTTVNITDIKRTEEKLKRKAEELQRFYDLTIDRELKMIELKKEINALLVKAGEKEKYIVHDTPKYT